MSRPPQNKVGDVVGQWTLLEYIPGRANPRTPYEWRCRCSCGKERQVQGKNIAGGRSVSCGHDISERTSEAMRRYHAAKHREEVFTPSTNPFAAARAYLSGATNA